MTAAASTLSHPLIPLGRRGVPLLHDAPAEHGKYQFQVVTGNVADAVRSIGGLIFDRAMAGWEVTVVVDGDTGSDDRPLRILGARVANRGSQPQQKLSRPHLLAVGTDVMVKSDAVRRQVLTIADDDETEVLLWGRHHPTNLNRTCVAVRHQLSTAAHVFKAQALTAGGAPGMRRADEDLYSLA